MCQRPPTSPVLLTLLITAVTITAQQTVTTTTHNIKDHDPEMSWDYVQELLEVAVFTIAAGAVFFLVALVWSTCRCRKGRCVPADLSKTSELVCLNV